MPEVQIEMFWACATCKHRNLGRDMKCAECGKPKADEPYIMPDDIEAAPVVTDSDLLRKATAGANWKCKYCSSEQRRLDGLCAQCGSNQKDSTDRRRHELDLKYDPLAPDECVCIPHTPHTEKDPFPSEEPRGTSPYREPGTRPEYPPDEGSLAPVSEDDLPFRRNVFREHPRVFLGGTAFALFIGLLAFFFWPHTVHAQVSSVSWQYRVEVDRYKVHHHEGFDEDEPASAFNVQAQGTRYHHSNHVLDHYETVTYTYEEACGQDCRTSQPVCTTTPRSCTSNKNGFATCTGGDRVCSGGGTTCSTRYCTRTGHREEPRYRDDPVYRTWYSWDNWEWGFERVVSTSGATTETHWPDASELKLCGTPDLSTCGSGEQERAGSRDSTYRVAFVDAEGKTYNRTPSDLGDFERFPVGSHWTIKVDRAGIVHDVVLDR